jgi:hypothetical protein
LAIAALAMNCYLATVLSVVILRDRISNSDFLRRYSAHVVVAIIGLSAWFTPVLMFVSGRFFFLAKGFLFAPALLVLVGRNPTIFRIDRKILSNIRLIFHDSDQQLTGVRTKFLIIFATMLSIFLAEVIALLFEVPPSVAFLLLVGMFCVVDIWLSNLYKQSENKSHMLAIAVITLVCLEITAGLPLSEFQLRVMLRVSNNIVQWLYSNGYVGEFVTDRINILTSVFQQAPAFLVGSVATLLASIAFWICLGFLAVWAFKRFRWQNGREIAVFVFASFILWRLFTEPFNVRDIRFLTNDRGADKHVELPTLQEQANRWLNERKSKIESSTTYPVFIINADGGGIRAAYWTASLLSALQDRDEEFSDHIFAISSVSGGSLGAAVFAAIAAETRASGTGPCQKLAISLIGKPRSSSWQECTYYILHRDFLAPALASMLVPDLLRTILPLGFLPDRAQSLEQGIETAWYWPNGSRLFSDSFTSLWSGGSGLHVPSLFLNSTDAQTGKRLVLSNVRLDNKSDRIDLQAMLGDRQLRLSTGVLLSARFPVISPAGQLPDESGAHTGSPLIVDGGYADNSGTVTAREAVDALVAATKSSAPSFDHVCIVGLMIANDPVAVKKKAWRDRVRPKQLFIVDRRLGISTCSNTGSVTSGAH